MNEELKRKAQGLVDTGVSELICECERLEARIAELEGIVARGPTAEPELPDPCPTCLKGSVCRTPKCGRLKLPAYHPYRIAPPAPSVPPGWKLVPVEPTPEMIEAGRNAWQAGFSETAIYEDMIAAREKP